ncbi:MAG: DUF1810 domain-containing protein [Prevotella sp.]|jgi:uncharacterized protein (DUF1810 family)|nr:DUF1810 domain-containing protein [Prevotella sp.]
MAAQKHTLDIRYWKTGLKNVAKYRFKRRIKIFGFPDVMKLKSPLTLFLVASGDSIFQEVLDKYYRSEKDEKTINIIRAFGFIGSIGCR